MIMRWAADDIIDDLADRNPVALADFWGFITGHLDNIFRKMAAWLYFTPEVLKKREKIPANNVSCQRKRDYG